MRYALPFLLCLLTSAHSETFFSSTDKPSQPSDPDRGSVELGVKVWFSKPGTLSAVRFYKGPQNPGPHTARVWSASGALLAGATFAGETATGWQQVALTPPLPVTAGPAYVVSYHAPRGGYSVSPYYFLQSRVNGSFNAPGGANGVYVYGSTPTFPRLTYQNSNYWVDAVFSAGATPTPSPTPTPAPQSVSFAWTASPSSSVSGYLLKYGTSPGAYPSSVDAGKTLAVTVTGLPRGVVHYFTVTAHDAAGHESLPSNEISF
jgi:hypothetical protein